MAPRHRPPPKLGDPIRAKAEIARNCLGCARFTLCRDPSKSWNYACTRFSPMQGLPDFTRGLAEIRDESAERAIAKLAVGTDKAREDKAVGRKKKASGAYGGEKQESELERMVNEALNTGFSVPPDLRINDKDLKLAPNFWQWFTGEEFLNSPQNFFPKQVEVAINLLGEYCPYCSDVEYAQDIPFDLKNVEDIWDHVQLLNYGRCPKCKATKSQMVAAGDLNEYYELAGVAGQRSGKSLMMSGIESYQMHRWVKSQNPQGIFNVMPQQVFMATYVAMTWTQAKSTLFDTIKNFVDGSPWFNEYHKLLDHYGAKYGEELYAVKEEYIRYSHRNLFFTPSGPNRGTLRGATRMAAYIDELGLFPFGEQNRDKVKMSGEQIYTSLQNAMTTLVAGHQNLLKKGNNNTPKPMIVAISSPIEVGDMIMQLYNASKGSRYTYGFKYATWDFNPTITKETPVIASAFNRNPSDAMRDFGAEPPMSSNAWISEISNVVNCFSKRPNFVRLRQFVARSKKTGRRHSTAEIAINARIRAPRVLCLDAGLVNNSFAFCTGFLDDDVATIDSIGEIMPSHQAPINFHRMYEDVLVPIATELNCNVIIADRWQSEKILNDFEEEVGANPIKQSLQYSTFSDLRDAIYNRKIRFPRLELSEEDITSASGDWRHRFMGNPVSHLLYQIMTVRDIPNKGVEKGAGATDDLFRTVALAYWGLNDPTIRELLGSAAPQARAVLVGAVMSGAHGGGAMRSASVGAVGARARFGEGDSASTKVGRVSGGQVDRVLGAVGGGGRG